MQRLGEDRALTRAVRARLRPRLRSAKARRVLLVHEQPQSWWRWAGYMLLVIGGVTILQFGAAGMDQLVGPQVGEGCTTNESCGPDELCLTSEGYCTRRCETQHDCPAAMTCDGRVCVAQ